MKEANFKKAYQLLSCWDQYMSEDQEIFVKTEKALGQGGQGRVNAVSISKSKDGEEEKMADKTCTVLNNLEIFMKALRAYMCEYYIAHDLQHPNVLQYKYLIRRYVPKTKTHEIHMLMEILNGGDLFDFIYKNKSQITVEQIKKLGGQLISGIKYIHDNCIVHQDLKPMNVLLSQDQSALKIIDFGVSTKLDSESHVLHSQIAGTYRYMPTEQHQGNVCLKSDVWAFGCVLLELAVGKQVFDGLNEFSLCYRISKGVTPLDHLTNQKECDLSLLNSNQDLKALIKKCLTLEYSKRPSSKEIFNDKFFSGHTTIVKKTAAIKNFNMNPAPKSEAKANNNAADQNRHFPGNFSALQDRPVASRQNVIGMKTNQKPQPNAANSSLVMTQTTRRNNYVLPNVQGSTHSQGSSAHKPMSRGSTRNGDRDLQSDQVNSTNVSMEA